MLDVEQKQAKVAEILQTQGKVVGNYRVSTAGKLWIIMKQIHTKSASHTRLVDNPQLFGAFLAQHDGICVCRKNLADLFGEQSVHDCMEGTVQADIPMDSVIALVRRDYHNVMHTMHITQRVRIYQNMLRRLIAQSSPDAIRLLNFVSAAVRLKIIAPDPAKVLGDAPTLEHNAEVVRQYVAHGERGEKLEAIALAKADFKFRHQFIVDGFRPVMKEDDIAFTVIGGGHSRHGSRVNVQLQGDFLEDYVEKEGGGVLVWEGRDYEYLNDNM